MGKREDWDDHGVDEYLDENVPFMLKCIVVAVCVVALTIFVVAAISVTLGDWTGG